jgi:CRISPR-associated endonuclease Cas1
VAAKLKSSIETLRNLPDAARVEKAITVHRASIDEIKSSPPKSIRALLGIEGRSAQAYFSAWKGLPLRWKGTGRKPIPADWTSFGARTSLQSTKPQNRNASHPMNAMLNYAYAVLESRVRSEIGAHGYDPMIGYLHSFDKDRAALVFDLMEPFRPVVDSVVLDLVGCRAFEPADFTIRKDGVCRLNPELARTLVRLLESQMFGISPLVKRNFLPTRASQ